jgi:hypothetical protein
MKKLFIFILIFFAFSMNAFAKKEVQPTSKNEIKLNLDGPQINLKSEPQKNKEDSINLKYSTDLKEKSNTRLFDNQAEKNRQQYSKTLDKKMADAPVPVYTYSDEPKSEEQVLLTPDINSQKTIIDRKVYTENTGDGDKKTDTVYSIKSFKDDRVDLDVGTEQAFPNENQPAKSQINIGTKIRL